MRFIERDPNAPQGTSINDNGPETPESERIYFNAATVTLHHMTVASVVLDSDDECYEAKGVAETTTALQANIILLLSWMLINMAQSKCRHVYLVGRNEELLSHCSL